MAQKNRCWSELDAVLPLLFLVQLDHLSSKTKQAEKGQKIKRTVEIKIAAAVSEPVSHLLSESGKFPAPGPAFCD